ncbi:MAG: hypothetical protein OEW39_08060 [Deltaproteobacteria bacterium]|nr:hypothetical protein [Deltaproteobacteria bacterium]
MLKPLGMTLALMLLFFPAVRGQTPESGAPAMAPAPQMETLFESTELTHGGYATFHSALTWVNGDLKSLSGVRGGWLINHTLFLGLGGQSVVTDFQGNTLAQNQQKTLGFGYGGLVVEWIPHWERSWHSVFTLLLGSGGVSTTYQETCSGNHCTYALSESDRVDVLELSVRLDLNVLRSLRIGLGAGYRHVAGLSFPYLAPDSLNGGKVEMLLTLGKF